MSRWFKLKYKSNYINLAAETSRNFYFQKQNYKLLSLNNKHVGAKLNRDQTIIKTIQKLLLKCFWKIEKQFKAFTVEAAQSRNRPSPLGARDARAFGPTADGQAAKPARRHAPLGPKLARHRRVAPSPSDSDPTAARARRANKTGDGGDPGTLAFILSLPVFSLHETEATAAGHFGRAE